GKRVLRPGVMQHGALEKRSVLLIFSVHERHGRNPRITWTAASNVCGLDHTVEFPAGIRLANRALSRDYRDGNHFSSKKRLLDAPQIDGCPSPLPHAHNDRYAVRSQLLVPPRFVHEFLEHAVPVITPSRRFNRTRSETGCDHAHRP